MAYVDVKGWKSEQPRSIACCPRSVALQHLADDETRPDATRRSCPGVLGDLANSISATGKGDGPAEAQGRAGVDASVPGSRAQAQATKRGVLADPGQDAFLQNVRAGRRGAALGGFHG